LKFETVPCTSPLPEFSSNGTHQEPDGNRIERS
jgi:hypothetical protein